MKKINPRKETEKRFKEKFKDYLNGKDVYIDDIRDRWSDSEVIYIFEAGFKIGNKTHNPIKEKLVNKKTRRYKNGSTKNIKGRSKGIRSTANQEHRRFARG